MFDHKYFGWNQVRMKGVVDFYGYKFFYFKKILDLGCGYGDLGGVLYRLGADLTAVDARQEHLKVLAKKYTGIKTVQANLDHNWPFYGQKYDLILDLGLLCHLENYEKHLMEVCASTTHLVLETAVCDSDDPNKVMQAPENKGMYDLSYNGMGCRPSPAAIERALRENGMNFKRMDNSKFNNNEYTYDWYPNNDNSTNLSKRRIWFAVKENSPLQFANPNSELAMAPISMPASHGYITPLVNSGIPVSASPKAPISARIEAEIKAKTDNIYTLPIPSPIRTYAKTLNVNERVRIDSKQFSLITPDDFTCPHTRSDHVAIILPTTTSSRMWYKKISPIFPKFKLSNKVISMPHFGKSDIIPNIIMCSLDNLQPYQRIFIDEWVSPALTEAHIEVLKKCSNIITPSLHNAQEIWKYIPHASVTRLSKPWPAIEVFPVEGNYFIYFEKSEELTDILLKSWDVALFGDLVVINSSLKLPTFARYVGDHEPYIQIMKYLMGAKGLIDLSENNYYNSGLINLALDIELSVISNNHNKIDHRLINIVQQDKKVSLLPTCTDIKITLDKFLQEKRNPVNIGGVNAHNNNFLIDDVRKLVGC